MTDEEFATTFTELAAHLGQAAGLMTKFDHPSFKHAFLLVTVIYRSLSRNDKGDAALLEAMHAQVKTFLEMRESIERINARADAEAK